MNEQDLKHIIEATLLAAGRPVTSQQLLDLFDERERPTPEVLQAALALLAADYENRGIELAEVASGWRIQVRPRSMDVVSRLWQERPSRYSRALLETLALIAYRQPITRSEIEEIRGVAISSTIMRTMQERNWIRVVGHREVPGRPELLGTTREFLDYFGLKSLDQLPTLADLRDVENIGVQLELPGGEASAQAAASEAETSEASAESTPETSEAATEEATADVAEESTAESTEESSEESSEESPEESIAEATEEASADETEDEASAESAESVESADASTEGDDLVEEDEDEDADDEGNSGSDASTLVASDDESDDAREMREPPVEQN